jgi:hypothetical protein
MSGVVCKLGLGKRSAKLPSGSVKFDRLASLPHTPELFPSFAIYTISRHKKKNEKNILKDNPEDLEDFSYFLTAFSFKEEADFLLENNGDRSCYR